MRGERTYSIPQRFFCTLLTCLFVAGCAHGVRQEIKTSALTPLGQDLSSYQRCRIVETSLRVPASGKCDHLQGAPGRPEGQ